MRDSLKDLTAAGDDYHCRMVKFAEELKRFGQQVSCSESNIGEQSWFAEIIPCNFIRL